MSFFVFDFFFQKQKLTSLESLRVRFLKVARSDLVARAKLTADAGVLRTGLDKAGKVVFDVVVEVQDAGGANIAELTVAWHVTKNRSG